MFNAEQDAYKAFRAIYAERTSQVIAWVGSGLSKSAGLPTWGELQRILEATIVSKADTLQEKDARQLRSRLNEIRLTKNPWHRFSLIEGALGGTTFRDTVKAALAPAAVARPPEAYELLWRLRLGGVLNLNLDRFAARAFQLVRPGHILHEFGGREAGSYLHILKLASPFVVNLHGVVEDSQNWVWTNGQLNALFETPGYQAFVSACLAAKVVLFLGVTADDVAAGGHLERFARSGIDPGTHFWITHRDDLETDAWAEAASIRVIRYSASDDDHSELSAILGDLLAFVPPEDETAPPITPDRDLVSGPAVPLPAPDVLAREDPEKARLLLNAEAAAILEPQTEEAYREYAEFCHRYDRAIHNAWYVTTEEPDNRILRYRLLEEIGEGAFGRVYRAIGPNGEDVAVKILHEEIRRKSGMIQSFRRGVRSMRILSDRGVSGMVPYLEASEIPALAAMEFVDGYDLKKAVEQGRVRDWPSILRVAKDLTRIIRAGHLLPERVLHRDIRPSNIMLKRVYSRASEWEVVVLDFDLSWHRGALEKSVAGPSAAYGYLAPEQLGLLEASTRHAAVDSYGLGMTLRFLCTGVDPMPGQHQHAKWVDSLRKEIGARPCREWVSLPVRFARLVENATKNEQHERWDVGQMLDELERLEEAMAAPGDVASAELWAEEILARSKVSDEYHWNADELFAQARLISGVAIRTTGREIQGDVQLTMIWSGTGTEEWRKVTKWIGRAADQAAAALRSGGWKVESPSSWTQSTVLSGNVSVAQLRGEHARVAQGLYKAAQFLRFE